MAEPRKGKTGKRRICACYRTKSDLSVNAYGSNYDNVTLLLVERRKTDASRYAPDTSQLDKINHFVYSYII